MDRTTAKEAFFREFNEAQRTQVVSLLGRYLDHKKLFRPEEEKIIKNSSIALLVVKLATDNLLFFCTIKFIGYIMFGKDLSYEGKLFEQVVPVLGDYRSLLDHEIETSFTRVENHRKRKLLTAVKMNNVLLRGEVQNTWFAFEQFKKCPKVGWDCSKLSDSEMMIRMQKAFFSAKDGASPRFQAVCLKENQVEIMRRLDVESFGLCFLVSYATETRPSMIVTIRSYIKSRALRTMRTGGQPEEEKAIELIQEKVKKKVKEEFTSAEIVMIWHLMVRFKEHREFKESEREVFLKYSTISSEDELDQKDFPYHCICRFVRFVYFGVRSLGPDKGYYDQIDSAFRQFRKLIDSDPEVFYKKVEDCRRKALLQRHPMTNPALKWKINVAWFAFEQFKEMIRWQGIMVDRDDDTILGKMQESFSKAKWIKRQTNNKKYLFTEARYEEEEVFQGLVSSYQVLFYVTENSAEKPSVLFSIQRMPSSACKGD